MTQITIHGRTYDTDDLRLMPAVSAAGEQCLQLEAPPTDGIDPHALTMIPYPSPAFAVCAETTSAAHKALLALGAILDLSRDVEDAEIRDRIEAAASEAMNSLRPALRAAGRI